MTKQTSLFGGTVGGMGALAGNFGVPPFSVLNAREGWWQTRKREWLALGIRSELGRGELANDRTVSAPARTNDAMDGKKRYDRKADAKTYGTKATAGQGKMIDQTFANKGRKATAVPGGGGQGANSAWMGRGVRSKDRKATAQPRGSQGDNTEWVGRGRKANAIPGGSLWPTRDPATGKIVRSDSKGRPINPGGLTYGPMRQVYAGVGGPLPGSLKKGLTFGEVESYDGADRSMSSGTSIFDPVLCEMVYRWFCPPGGVVLDPFAGGSVRGIVAAKMGRHYVGLDLSEIQIAANQDQADIICRDDSYVPEWLVGDSRDINKVAADVDADLLFSCPPYGDLEVYSDDPRDLSRLTWEKFCDDYATIITNSLKHLKDNRFACFVVGDFRGPDGIYRGFPWTTIQAFAEAGAGLYNEAILVTAIGSLPVRIDKMFRGSRKLGKTHQQCLVFVKGDAKKATEACGEV